MWWLAFLGRFSAIPVMLPHSCANYAHEWGHPKLAAWLLVMAVGVNIFADGF